MPARKKPDAAEQLAEYHRKRDFARTGEPRGGASPRRGRGGDGGGGGRGRGPARRRLEFVIQKHAATRLHFDLRLELDGVMKSWAVPRGPSPDPADKRLAVQVEDHPMEYNAFEGTIPRGEYGGGTVMIWDRGWYEPESKGGGEDALRAGWHKGDLKIVFHGKRMKGAWVLVRTRNYGDDGKPSWLLIKHRDKYAEPGGDLVETHLTSVATRRTMEQIGGAPRPRVWHSRPRESGTDWAGAALPKRTRSVAEVRRERAAAAAAAVAAASETAEAGEDKPR